MPIYFDFKVNTKHGTILNCVEWHQQLPLLAVGSCTPQPLRSYISVLDQLGEPLTDMTELDLEGNGINSLAWHPSKKILIAGFSSGDMHMWNGQPEFVNISSPHSTAVKFVKWSELGTRLVSIDQNGVLIGWKVDSRSSISRVYESNVNFIPVSVCFCCGKPGLDVNALAKKAVAGDEKALDIFSTWRPKTGGHRTTFSADNACFYLATFPNKLHFVDENGNITNVANCENGVQLILQHTKKDLLIVILDDFSVNQFLTSSDGKLQIMNKVKLSDVEETSTFISAGDDLLACTTIRYAIRFLNINSGDTYVLYSSANSNEKQIFTTISYLPEKGILCGGSNVGDVTMWKKNNSKMSINGWEELSTCKIKEKIVYSIWGSQHCVIVAGDSLYMLQEHELCYSYNKRVCVVQRTSNEVVLTRKNKSIHLNTDLKIIGVAVSEEHVAVWSGKTVAVYNLTDLTALNVLGTFSCDCETAHIYEQSLVILPNSALKSGKLLIYTFQGTLKQNLDCDGQPIATHLNQSYLIVATIIGMVQTWDLSRREAKPYVHPKDLVDAIPDFGEVVMIRINSTGTKASLTIANSNLIPSHYIYVWDTENDTIIHYQFEHFDRQFAEDQFYITSHYWDVDEPDLIVCETKTTNKNENDSAKLITDDFPLPSTLKKETNLPQLVTLFVSKENGIVVQDKVTVTFDYVMLLGIDVPYFIILKKSVSDSYASMDKITMNYFDEESVSNEAIRSAIVKFSFNLSIGNLDEAFKIISNINNINVWTNLTKMCIKEKRLDVARICLGHMKDARGVSVLRSLDIESELEVKLAALALHLGMLTEAENLYKSVGRYDLLNKMYQSLNQWSEAVTLAEKHDRIHLRNTYDAYGRYLESEGEIQKAIRMYELANTHRKHVPRLLLKNPIGLEKYIMKSKDPILIKWWAQYIETCNMEMSIKYYQEAKDHTSIVRILCFLKNTEQAAEVANASGDPAAFYYLARHYENLGEIDNAVNFFVKSNFYTNAVRICKENGLDDQLWQISLYAGKNEKLNAAKYFESVDPHRSVILYQKAENFHRALYIAFKYGLHESVEQISSELNPETQAELLEKCADYFLRNEQFDGAVKLLANAKKFEEATSICNKRRVHLTEELSDLLTPVQDHVNRINIINELGELSFLQGNYHLAAKKFTQAGNKLKAMKALLKSGDTEKIIFFANVSREKEIYIMAANYLQTLDWQMQPEYLKHIVNFYTKGKAPHLLANFYVACAQIEVDEYGNYEKCIGALNEALRCLSKDPDHFGQVLEYITKKLNSVKRFLDVRRQFEKGEEEAGMVQCRQLLNLDLDLVRRGDIYSLMIEYLMKHNDWNTAIQMANEMKKNLPNDNLAYYITKETLQKLGIEIESNEKQKPDIPLEEIEDVSIMQNDNI